MQTHSGNFNEFKMAANMKISGEKKTSLSSAESAWRTNPSILTPMWCPTCNWEAGMCHQVLIRTGRQHGSQQTAPRTAGANHKSIYKDTSPYRTQIELHPRRQIELQTKPITENMYLSHATITFDDFQCTKEWSIQWICYVLDGFGICWGIITGFMMGIKLNQTPSAFELNV
jgi:hypothetical protein